MTDPRICISFPGWRSRPSSSGLVLAILGPCGILISGCIAQQADLNRLKKDLDDQIIQIQKEKKELRAEVTKAREAIAEGKKQTAELKAENKKLFRFRAEMKSDFREFREKDFADFNGRIEEINKRLEDLQSELKAENTQIGGHIQEIETQMQAQQVELTAQEAKTVAVIQQVDQDGASTNQKIAEFQAALTTFKESLADLGSKFVQEAERDSRVETELSQQMGQNVQLSQATLAEIQTHLAANTANIDEVSQSVTTIKEAVGQSGSLLGSRVEEEAARVAVLESKQSQLEKDILTATEKLNMDTQALKTYFEQDVQSTMGTLQGDLVGLETQLATQSNEIQELRQTALQLKEHQGVMGNLLGQRGDDLIQQAGRLDERIKILESHQTSADQTMETNRQSTTRHLDELTASLTSMNQALQKTTGDFATQLTTQEQALNDLTQLNTQLNTRIDQQEQHLNKKLTSLQSVDGLKKTTRDNRSHLNQLTETVNKLRDVLTTIGKKFGERVDQHEERIAQLAKRINQLQAKKVKK
jgi:chromosome segregation ATPase